MIEQIGGFIGMLAADVRNFFRGRQAVPCTADFSDEWWQQVEQGDYIDPNFDPDAYELDDGCGTCDTDCCVSTDTLREMREWNQRK